MAIGYISGFGGSASFDLGPEQNRFVASTRALAESARDAYATANPTWLAQYNANKTFNIILEYTDGGNTFAVYQVRSAAGTLWADNSSAVAIKGDTGPAGATGNSFFFKTIAERDTFFNTGTNKQLLETGLPVLVGEDTVSAAPYTWSGDNQPTTYNPALFARSTLKSGTGSFKLADSHSISSSGQNISTTNLFSNLTYHPVWQTYGVGNTATNRTRVANPDVTLSDKSANLSNPVWTNTPSTINQTLVAVKIDVVNPISNLIVAINIGGVGFYRNEFGPFAAGEQTVTIDPPFDVKQGDVLSLTMQDGATGTATVKGNSSTGIPWQVLTTRTWTDRKVPYVATTTAAPNEIVVFDGVGANGLTTNGTAVLRSPDSVSGTPTLNIEDSAGTPKIAISHSDLNDNNNIISGVDLNVTTTGSTGLSSSNAGTTSGLGIAQTGTGGGSVKLGVKSTGTPEGYNLGSTGDLVISNSGGAYIKAGGTNTNTGWISLVGHAARGTARRTSVDGVLFRLTSTPTPFLSYNSTGPDKGDMSFVDDVGVVAANVNDVANGDTYEVNATITFRMSNDKEIIFQIGHNNLAGTDLVLTELQTRYKSRSGEGTSNNTYYTATITGVFNTPSGIAANPRVMNLYWYSPDSGNLVFHETSLLIKRAG